MTATYQKDLFEAAYDRMQRDPRSLTDADIAQLATIDPPLSAKAAAERTKAYMPASSPPPPTKRKRDRRPAYYDSNVLAQKDQTIEEDCKRSPLSATPLAYFGKALEAIALLLTRTKALEQRLTALEAEPRLKYAGVYKQGMAYSAGATVTWGGSLWIAKDTTTETPGDGATAWQLAVKRGRDGKDAK